MTSLKGIIIPVNWDNSGNVLSVAIATRDEDEYLIEDQGLAEKLMALLRKEVEVSGIVEKKKGKKIIKITEWRCQNA